MGRAGVEGSPAGEGAKTLAVELLELADRAYQVGSDPERLAQLLNDVASAVGVERIERVDDARRERSLARPNGSVETIVLPGGESLSLFVSPRDLAPGARQLVLGFGVHLARALSRAAKTTGESERRALATLDRLAAAVGVLDGAGRLVQANRSLRHLLDGGGPVRLQGEALAFGSEADAHRFRDLFAAARADAPTHRPGGGVLRVARGDGQTPMELLVVPLRNLDLQGSRPGWALFVVDPERAAEAPEEILRRLYGLTATESRVVGELLAGRSIEELTTRLGIRRETARTHLRRIFAKVGTTRQIDLVRRLLTGAGGVSWE